MPSFIHRHTHPETSVTVSSNRRTVRVFSRAAPNFSLTIRDGNVILAPSNPVDDYQHWYKDEKHSTRVKDQEGFPAFSLVNKATGEAIKHSIGATHPVRLIPYKSVYLDESVLWTESKEIADGYRAMRMVNNIHLNVDAFHGDQRSGGVHDGTTIVLWDWNKGDNQLWRIAPYCLDGKSSFRGYKLSTRGNFLNFSCTAQLIQVLFQNFRRTKNIILFQFMKQGEFGDVGFFPDVIFHSCYD